MINEKDVEITLIIKKLLKNYEDLNKANVNYDQIDRDIAENLSQLVDLVDLNESNFFKSFTIFIDLVEFCNSNNKRRAHQQLFSAILDCYPELLKAKDQNGNNILHFILNKKLNYLIECLPNSDKERLFSEKNKAGDTPKNIAILYRNTEAEFLSSKDQAAFCPELLSRWAKMGNITQKYPKRKKPISQICSIAILESVLHTQLNKKDYKAFIRALNNACETLPVCESLFSILAYLSYSNKGRENLEDRIESVGRVSAEARKLRDNSNSGRNSDDADDVEYSKESEEKLSEEKHFELSSEPSLTRSITIAEDNVTNYMAERIGFKIYLLRKEDFDKTLIKECSSLLGYYHFDDTIYILYNPGQNLENIVATFIHESFHYIIDVLFKNKARPFHMDYVEEGEFDQIINETKNKLFMFLQFCCVVNPMAEGSLDPITLNVLTTLQSVFMQYPEEQYSAELIVRVPQLYYQHGEDKVRKVLSVLAPKLQDYFDKVIVEKQMKPFMIKENIIFKNILRLSCSTGRNSKISLRYYENKKVLNYLIFGPRGENDKKPEEDNSVQHLLPQLRSKKKKCNYSA